MEFIGVDVHKESLLVACINKNKDINILEKMSIQSFMDYLKEKEEYIVGVDAPYGVNKGFMDNENYRKLLGLKSDAHRNKKVSEYELSRRGISLHTTPGKLAEVSGWKSWMKTGFKLYDELKLIGCTMLSSDSNLKQIKMGFAEVFPHGCFTTLLGYVPEKKDTEEGITERINLLRQLGFKSIENYLEDCSKHTKTDKLDALVAAFTALSIIEVNITFVGEAKEGEIIVPVKELKDRYKKLRVLKSDEIKGNEKTSSDLLVIQQYVYVYSHDDSVLWFKHFKSLGNSPSISEIFMHEGQNIGRKKAKVFNLNGEGVEVELQQLKGDFSGIKVANEYKSLMANFWGSNGDKKEYKVIVYI